MTYQHILSNGDNKVHYGWIPNKLMVLTKPGQKSSPVSYHKGKKVSWTSKQYDDDFDKIFLYDQLESGSADEGCNLAVIPTEKYWILDLDSGKVDDEIKDPEQLVAYRLLEQMALAHGLHIVTTPNKGYHVYLPVNGVGEIVKRTHHLPCCDIQYKDVYVVAPYSTLTGGGKYEILKWHPKSPEKAHKEAGGVNQSLLTALDRYIQRGDKVKQSVLVETVKDDVIQQDIISLDEQGTADAFPDPFTEEEYKASEIISFVHNAFNHPNFKAEKYEKWAEFTSSYSIWRNLAHSLKCSAKLWHGDDGAFEAFNWISNCSPKYDEPDGNGLTGRKACQSLWDKQKYEPEKAEISYNGFRKRVFEEDDWVLNSINCHNYYQSHNLVSQVIQNWVKTCIRLVYSGKNKTAYKINQTTMLWEESPGGLDIAWPKITKISLKMSKMFCSVDGYLPILINPKLNNCAKKGSAEETWSATDGNPKIEDLETWSYSDRQDYQRFYLRKWFGDKQNSLEFGQNKAPILTYLNTGIIDYTFAKKANMIPDLFPLKDAFNINLKTNTLVKRTAEDYFTHCSPCSSKDFNLAKSGDDRWFERKFISPMVGRDQANIDYAMKMLGSSLCGEQIHAILGLIQGKGRNGKGYLLDILEYVLAGFFHKLPCDYWSLPSKTNLTVADPVLHGCKGKRLIVMDEASDDATINTLTVKSMTGGGSISARPLYGDMETFPPTWSCFGVTNDLLKIDCVETSMKERMRIMKCNTRFFDEGHPEYNDANPNHAIGDKDLLRLARQKFIGSVVYTLAEGCRRYYTESMADVPEDWLDTLNDYYNDKYPFNRFVKATMISKSGGHIPTSKFKEMWSNWVRAPEYEGHEGAFIGEYKNNKSSINKKLTHEMGFKISKKSYDGGPRVECLVDWVINPEFKPYGSAFGSNFTESENGDLDM